MLSAVVALHGKFASKMKLLLFMDDIVVVVHKALLAAFVNMLRARLAAMGLWFNLLKCMAMVQGVDDDVMSAEVRDAGLQQVWGQLPLLGSSLADEYEFELQQAGCCVLHKATAKRMVKVEEKLRL